MSVCIWPSPRCCPSSAMALQAQAAAMALLLLTYITSAAGCQDAQAGLAYHNECRAKHSAGTLVWNAGAEAGAREWAKNLAARGCVLEHSTWSQRSPMGENLYSLKGGAGAEDMSLCVAAARMWYAEEKLYKYTSTPWTSNEAQFHKIGHFTQMVWRATSGVGCAAATGKDCIVVVCRYVDSGNLVTDQAFLDNVKPGSGARRMLAGRTVRQ